MNIDQDKPEEFRCVACKALVDPGSEHWRKGFDCWEHMCPGRHPNGGHCDSERIPVEAVAAS